VQLCQIHLSVSHHAHFWNCHNTKLHLSPSLAIVIKAAIMVKIDVVALILVDAGNLVDKNPDNSLFSNCPTRDAKVLALLLDIYGESAFNLLEHTKIYYLKSDAAKRGDMRRVLQTFSGALVNARRAAANIVHGIPSPRGKNSFRLASLATRAEMDEGDNAGVMFTKAKVGQLRIEFSQECRHIYDGMRRQDTTLHELGNNLNELNNRLKTIEQRASKEADRNVKNEDVQNKDGTDGGVEDMDVEYI